MRIRIQKNDIAAKTAYDFRRLEEKSHLFLPCMIEEEKEAVSISFDLQGMKSFEELKGEDIYIKLRALLAAGELKEVYRKYEFPLEPGNLYYDILCRVKVKQRDIILSGGKNRMKYFLKQYQALIIYILEGIRTYEDYLYASRELLKADHKLVMLLEPETVQEERKILLEYYINLQEEERNTTRRVNCKKYKWLIRYSGISVILLILLLTASVYSFGWHMPRQKLLVEAGEAYIKKDYTDMINALGRFQAAELDRTYKYMLAAAYIKGQAVDTFSVRDKEAILSKVTWQSNENILEYWIHLGRLEVKEAENLAMKLSDDQLLLYAYMHELRQVEDAVELSGEEKRKKKQELLKEIEALAEGLGISYGDEAGED